VTCAPKDAGVAIEDRDWYREQPSKEWKRRRLGGSSSPAAGSSSSVRVHSGAWLAIAVSVVAAAVVWKTDVFDLRVSGGSTPAPRVQAHKPSNEVTLGTDPALWSRAASSGKWSISDPRFGTIDVQVAAGEVPATVIARVLTERGYSVSIPASPATG
jgi:hypothetical protein